MSILMRKLMAHGGYRDEAGDDKGGGGGTDEAAKAAAAKAAADKAAADKAEADRVAAEKAEADKKKSSMTDSEAKLLKEVMEAKEKLKAYAGIDPEKAKKALDALAQKEAEAAAAEQKRLEEAGNWDALKKQMNEQTDALVKAKDAEIAQLKEATQAASSTIAELTVGAAFSQSKFIGEDLALTPSKARIVYGSHFVFEEGKVVAYDKPAGAKGRVMLVDGRGDPLGFEDAIKKIVDSDPDKDSMLKSKIKTGAGSTTTNADDDKKKGNEGDGAFGVDRITAALAAKKK